MIERIDTVRVLIADPDALARRMVRDALADATGVTIVAQAIDGREAGESARYHRPDVVLAEVRLPGTDGLELARQLARDLPDTRVVLLSASDDDDLAVRAVRAGAVGYLTKDVDPGLLPHVVRKVAAGEAVIPRSAVMRVLEWMREVPDSGWRPVRSRLTSREWEMVDLLAAGATTRRSPSSSFSPRPPSTATSRTSSAKLSVHSRQEAVDVAERLRREEAAPAQL
jgi:DNA-binding NarL/FixJ family response regulator